MEIERKFLVKWLPDILQNREEVYSKSIEQYYINMTPEIRLRNIDNSYFMTVKSDGTLIRNETEIEVSQHQYIQLQSFIIGNIIEKTRYIIPSGDLVYELDIYDNIKYANERLITVEVEFVTENDAMNFNPPDWFGVEITKINQFKNKNLALIIGGR